MRKWSCDSAKRAEIYRKAARGMECRFLGLGWSCWAICKVAGLEPYDAADTPPLIVRQYERIFSPYAPKHEHWWGHGWNHDDKILALCFMAAMVEAGDA
jgi:hypothetical protein